VKQDDKENKQEKINKVGREDDDAYPSRRPCCSAVKIAASTFNQTLNPKSILLLHTAEWENGETKSGTLMVELQKHKTIYSFAKSNAQKKLCCLSRSRCARARAVVELALLSTSRECGSQRKRGRRTLSMPLWMKNFTKHHSFISNVSLMDAPCG
jgi:hypothetical protein